MIAKVALFALACSIGAMMLWLQLFSAVDLREIFNRHLSDKGNYAGMYTLLIGDRRNAVRDVLEIGIGTPVTMKHMGPRYRSGASLRAWREYFPHAHIVGVDIDPMALIAEPRIRTFVADSTSAELVATLFQNSNPSIPAMYDLVVDDGSHRTEDQIRTLANFYPHLRAGGLYVIEDTGLQTETMNTSAALARVRAIVSPASLMFMAGGDCLVIQR